MTNEIKEILDYLNKFINDKEEITKYGCEISVKNAKILLDYITNLQEENEMYAQLKDEYEDIIDKATQYYLTKLDEYNKQNKPMPDVAVTMFNILENNKND